MSKKKAAARNKRPDLLYIILLFVSFLLVYQYIFNPKINLGGDNAGYYILGKAISEGKGFTDIHKVTETPHTHFPPGYPAILGVFMTISKSINFVKILNGVFLLGSTILLYFLLHRFTKDRRVAFAGAILSLFNMHLLNYSSIMMSELPFLFFTTLSFFLFVKTLSSANFLKDPYFYGFLLSSAFSYHIRSVGIAMIAGIAVYLLFNKKFKYLGAYLGGFALLSLPWYLRNQAVDKGSGYLASVLQKNPYRPEQGQLDLMGIGERILENLQRYLAKEIPNGLMPFIEVDYKADVLPQDLIPGILIIGLIIFALIKIPSFGNLLLWYFLGNFAIFMVWPEVWFGIRFMLPLIPLMLFLMVYGIYRLLVLLTDRIKLKVKPSPLLMLLMVFPLMPQLKKLKAAAESPMVPKYKNYFQVASYCNQNLPADAVVCCRKPTLFYLYANRKTTKYRNETDYSKLLEDLDTLGTTHVVIDQLGYSSTARYLVPAVQSNMEKFQVVYQQQNPTTYLLRFNPDIGYQGEWKKTKEATDKRAAEYVKHGQGRYVYQDGRVYEGQWKNGKRHGQGTLTFPDGRVRKGIWKNGQFQQN